jgi:phosphohistidine phosphatase SixA
MNLLAALLLAQQMLFLVRHGEKVDNSRDAALSAAGEARANGLADKLRDAGITAIFTSEYQRTRNTAAPLAAKLKLEPQVHKADDTPGLVALLHKTDRALVVGHSNTLPEIARAYGVRLEIADDEYDSIFLLLPGDKPLLVRLH